MKTFEFTFTREQFEAIRKKLKDQGVALIRDEGDIGKYGVELHFKYDEPNLVIIETYKPFYISDSTVTNNVNNWFAKNEV